MDVDDDGAESSVRDDVAAAMESSSESAVESTPAPSPAPAESSSSAPAKTTTTTAGRDDKGRFAPGRAPGIPIGSSPAIPEKAHPGKPLTTTPEVKSAVVPAALKAPASWKPVAREKWAALPPEVQQETLRREHEVSRTLSETAEARKGFAEYQRAVAPYEGMIRAEGATPMQAIQSLLQTSVALRTAPPAHKAQLVAAMVRQYGISIEALDAALAGQPIPQRTNGQDQPMRDPRVDDLLARVRQGEQAQSARIQAKADTTIGGFAEAHEFFDDVAEDFQLVLEAMARRNPEVDPDLEQVYARAVAMNPEIAQVVAQRDAAKAQATGNPATRRAQVAATSIRSTPAGSPHVGEPRSVRDEVAAIYSQFET